MENKLPKVWCVLNDDSQLFKLSVLNYLNKPPYSAKFVGEYTTGANAGMHYGVNSFNEAKCHQNVSNFGSNVQILTVKEFIKLSGAKRNLVIDEDDAYRLYPSASPVLKKIMEDAFGKEHFEYKPITERINTYKDAFDMLDKQDIQWIHEMINVDDAGYRKLKVIACALNEGWTPDWLDGEQRKWYPTFTLSLNEGKLKFSKAVYDLQCLDANSALVFKSEKLAEYAGTCFIDLYSDYLLHIGDK